MLQTSDAGFEHGLPASELNFTRGQYAYLRARRWTVEGAWDIIRPRRRVRLDLFGDRLSGDEGAAPECGSLLVPG